MQKLVAILDLIFLGAHIKIMIIWVIMLYICGYNIVLS
jgi:hypothetical protein